MSPADRIEAYLHREIPLSRAMGIRVVEADEEQVRLAIPLAPNINHRQTVFGGSASASATLAAWCLLYHRLSASGHPPKLVIQANTMRYLQPIAGDFEAIATLRDRERWDRFLDVLRRRGKARIRVPAELLASQGLCGQFDGDFVALGGR